MPDQFVMCARAVENGHFTDEPGPTLFLMVPEGKRPLPEHAVKKPDQWFKKLRLAATWGKDSRDNKLDRGDLLVFVHGYNNDQAIVMARHTQLKHDLIAAGYKGEIMSFDWPSSDKALNYLKDRHEAKITAWQIIHGLSARLCLSVAIYPLLQ